MSHFGDDGFEMSRRQLLDDDAVEAVLAGVPAGDDLAGLTAFVDDVRTASTGPTPVPSAAFAEVLARGFSTDQGDLPATAASNANGSAPQTAGLPKWRRAMVKTSQFVAGLSMAAKVALGAGVAVAATATAGVAGVLPGPVQHAVADAVGSVTPFELPGATTDQPTADGPGTGGSAPATPGTDGNGAPGAGSGSSPGSGSGPATGAPSGSTEPGTPAGDPTPPPVTDAPATPPVTTPATPGPVDEPKVPQTLTISSAVNGDHHVVCSWTGADPATFGRYLLLRTSSDGKPGRVLLQSGDIGTTTWDDSLDLTPGVTYGYMVLVQDPGGASITHSPYVYVTP